jgi:thioredoxin 1
LILTVTTVATIAIMSTTRTKSTAGAATRVLTDDTFGQEIEEARGLALVDFGADWCPPCRMMAPVIEALAQEYAGRVLIGAIDVDTSRRVTARYRVRHFPTFLFFRDGQVVERIIGSVPASQLRERLTTLLANAPNLESSASSFMSGPRWSLEWSQVW